MTKPKKRMQRQQQQRLQLQQQILLQKQQERQIQRQRRRMQVTFHSRDRLSIVFTIIYF